jgi:hypothetical protein
METGFRMGVVRGEARFGVLRKTARFFPVGRLRVWMTQLEYAFRADIAVGF